MKKQKMTAQEFKDRYDCIMLLKRQVKYQIKDLKKAARRLYRDADRSGLFVKKYSKRFVRLDDIVFGNNF